ncbi:MAG: 50S ribosome-binding GTPase [Candidatus Shikimatogenerans bostrichidophilus]|nr:MAG: 50S ribosome-binding GTPase [Candidatus Shikimatogenerans bostrichidophilus]
MLFNNFIDNIIIYCISGNGGNGKVHFKKKNKKIGKPDGGNGGKGGDIILKGNKNLNSLFLLKKKYIYKACNGLNGMKNCKTGKDGKNCIINVPINTIIKYDKKKIIIKNNNQKKKILLGGKGGKGNFFFKNSKNQKTIKFSKGENGIKKKINIILNIKIDISIIGLPNTGKSTILSLITKSKPKINNYLFTTIIPNFGIYIKKKNIYIKKYKIIDLPGIIKNSYKGKGIGNYYLKYIKYNKILLIVINCKNLKEYYNQYNILKKEIKKSKIKINKKKIIIIISKYDCINNKNKKILKYNIKKKNNNLCFFSIYKKKKKNINKLKKYINKYL